MADFKYYSAGAGNWVDIPAEAYHGTYEGDLTVQYPAPESYDGNGRRCAAVGKPVLRLKSNIMTACGMNFWHNMQTDTTVEDSFIYISAVDPRTGWWTNWQGYLERPTWGRVRPGSSSPQTFYFDVQIVINELTPAPDR